MEKPKKLNKVKVSIVIVLIVLVFSLSVFGRYISASIKEAYFAARQFYFSSDILTVAGAEYQYNNWGGLDVYPIEIQLRSYINERAKLNYDLNYSATVTVNEGYTDKIKCTLNSYTEGAQSTISGTISSQTNVDALVVYVKPLVQIQKDESVKLTVTASTSEPYVKEISCEFTLTPEILAGVSYTIEDVTNRDYAVLRITNTASSGAQVQLQYDPTKLVIDSNDAIYVEKVSEATTSVDGKNYVNKLVFNMEKEFTRYVKFYKVDRTQNYTFPGVQATTPITVTTI